MAHFAIFYDYDPTLTETMDEVRPLHRAYLTGLKDRGLNVASGPLGDGAPGALLIFEAESADEVAALLDEDPFMKAGVILTRTIRSWNPVISRY
ncbi:YciI family protein [Actinomyces culturomici]|uniref:YciI family protein n=1 Tax=Actinomyces culturomici TaxID=1926276 RepID=UPI000E20B518|nr:YciI family protein [Actinomyces culturomici]